LVYGTLGRFFWSGEWTVPARSVVAIEVGVVPTGRQWLVHLIVVSTRANCLIWGGAGELEDKTIYLYAGGFGYGKVKVELPQGYVYTEGKTMYILIINYDYVSRYFFIYAFGVDAPMI